MIKTKRVYDPPSLDDGQRILVDRLWPRGMKKEKLKADAWMKEAAPSHELRKQFSHQPSQWEEFCERYFEELDKNPEVWMPIRDAAQNGNVTLLFAARDQDRNNAVALKQYLERKTSSE